MVPEPIPVDEKLLWLVYEFYPSPLANPFVRLASELRKSRPNWFEAYSRTLDCFEISVKLLGLAAASVYIPAAFGEKQVVRSKGAEDCILRLRNQPKQFTGWWWELLRETLPTLDGGPGCLPEIARRYVDPLRANAEGKVLRDALNTVTDLRNAKAHGKTQEPGSYYEPLIQPYRLLEQWLWALDVFRTHWLAVCVNCEQRDARFRVELEIRRGSHHDNPRYCVDSASPLLPNRVYWIEERDLEGIPADRPPLPLHPFAIVDPEASPEEAGETGDVLLFDAFTDKEILYDCRRGSAKKYATSGILRDDFLTAVSPLLASNGQLVGMPREIVKFIKPYAARLGERTQAFLKREKQKTYRPELQVPRRDTESKVAKFLESDKAALLVSGPSGIGKTCFVCRFAEERQKVDDSPTLVLLLAADSLPQSDISLERAVREILDPGKTVREWIADARRRFPNYRNLRLVVIVDGTDKHPSIANVLHAVDQWVRNTAVDMPELKLIATFSPGGLNRAGDEIAKLDSDRYYTQTSGDIEGQSYAARLPAIQMKPFDEGELEEAYGKYQEAGFKPTTSFKRLQDKPAAKRALSHPLFLRLVTEAYNNEEIPPNPISFQTLQKYCAANVFTNRVRRSFVNALVDTMLDLRVQEISGQQMRNEPTLRQVYLETKSTFDELLAEQVLSTYQRTKSQFPVPIDEDYVEFALDRVFQFLLMMRVLDTHPGGPEAALGEGLAGALETAKEFQPLRAGLVDLLAEVARRGQIAVDGKETVFAQVCRLSNRGADEWVMQLLCDVLAALAVDAPYGEDPQDDADAGAPARPEEDPLQLVLGDVFQSLDEGTVLPRFTATAEDLFRRGLWEDCVTLLRHLAKPGNLTEQGQFSVQNQLVKVLKNKDQWDQAKHYSDENDKIFERLEERDPSPQRRARHRLNRFSVLYDVGERGEAFRLCTDANEVARAHGLKLEEAATANNLGIAEVYFDHPRKAEEKLSEGIAAAGGFDIVAGHNYLDRGLVRMVRWQLNPSAELLRGAEQDIEESRRLFEKMGYPQGILYGDASKGLVEQYKARALLYPLAGLPPKRRESHKDYTRGLACLERAHSMMTSGLEMARELGEDWPDYGIQTDLALWHLEHPSPDLDKALECAGGAYELIGGDQGFEDDPEGTAIISMALARVLLARKGDRDRIIHLLEGAERQFVKLEFYSAAARAAAGLVETARLFSLDASSYETRRAKFRGHFQDNPEFPVNFAETFEPMDWKLLFLVELF